MGRFGLAVRLFFRVLRDGAFARQVQQLPAAPEAAAPAAPVKAAPAPPRSDALNLLAVLQREARLVDFLKESIAPYSDAQVGAAVRDVHRDAAAALERLFALRPVMEQAEGAPVQLSAGFDAGKVRLTGNVAGEPPYSGTLRHQGWQATKLQLPEWSGSEPSAKVVAPAEVEVGGR